MSQNLYRSNHSRKPVSGWIIAGFAFLTALFAPPAAADQEISTTKLRVVAFNVACGQWATPEQVAAALKSLKPDIVLLNEVPKANAGEDVRDWSHRVAEKLNLKHVLVGSVSSANHKAPRWGDVTGKYGGKFKSILSRTPLTKCKDFQAEGSGWKPASAVRVETEIGGRKFAIYSLHLPGFAHHKRQPTQASAWEGSKHKSLAKIINAEDDSYDIIVGGDFNEWNDGVVMRSMMKDCKLENAITSRSIDHILYSTARPIKVLDAQRDWGPKNQTKQNERSEGHLSDHPWVYCELEIAAGIGSKTAESSINVMSYNVYRGGEMRGQPLSQTAKVIQEAKADIVGLQEMHSPKGDNGEKLAQLLGWNHDGKQATSIITRYEILEHLRDGIKVKLPSGKEAYVFNLHLASNPYQPYQLLGIRPKWHKHWDTPFIKTEAEAIAAAKEARGRDITRLLRQIRSLPDKETPVFVVGDFNEPSNLDWTEKAAKSGRHPIKVEYPTSLEMTKAGFADAWRTVYPDEMKKPGYTWTPSMKSDDPKTHHDRIDFVYFKGKGLTVNGAKIVGENQENADIVVSPYPSDHRAVVATFTQKSMVPAGNHQTPPRN